MKQELENINWKKLDREQRGKLIFQSAKVFDTPNGWSVTSQTNSGHRYRVRFKGHEPKCDCPDNTMRKKKCKHIWAVEFYARKEIDEKGKITETKGVRITYAQHWKAYDKSQTNEKLIFLKLLRDLCNFIEQPNYKFGRPKLSYADMIFGSALKVYTTFSLRRFMSDMKIAKEMKLVDDIPTYMTISNYMNKKETTNILEKLISISASPLKEIENDFAVDASGFSTSRFARWFDHKWGKEKKERIWIKCHAMSGVKTNIITSVKITEGHKNDSPQLASLVKRTAKHFEVKEVSCDRAYSSRENLKLIADVGATPYIPFKSNVTGKRAVKSVWGRMYHYFMFKNEEFMQHYHKRSNSETVFHMIKTKFRDNLLSKSKTSQINELLLKVLCHNICVVIQEVNELGLKGEFIMEKENEKLA